MYKVLVPFQMNGESLIRGRLIGDEVELAANYHFLRKDGYVLKLEDKTGIPYVLGCYIVTQSFSGRGKAYSVNDFIDIREEQWRNEAALLESGYLKYATEDDVARHSAHSPLNRPEMGAAPGPLTGKVKMWRDEGWLQKRYIGENASMPEMAEEAQCSVSTIWAALKGASINTRSRGRPSKG